MSGQVFEMSTLNDKLNKFDARLEQSKLHDTSNNKFERKRQLWLSSCSQESGTSADATYGRWGQKSEKKGEKNTKKGNTTNFDFLQSLRCPRTAEHTAHCGRPEKLNRRHLETKSLDGFV